MTMKHTPGPWTVDAMGFIYASADSELPENSNQGAQLVLAKLLSHSTVRTAGNASLIAAAPDLLAAMEGIINLHGKACNGLPFSENETQEWTNAHYVARAAIRKAKGE